VWSVVTAVRVYQQLLHMKLQHRPDLLDCLYYANVKVCHSLCQTSRYLACT